VFDVGFMCVPISINLGVWVHVDNFLITWGFLFDSLSTMMLVVISTVSTIVHLYSCSYMEHDPYITRFMSYLSLFTFFMLVLVISDNLIQLFFGWEGVGLCLFYRPW
jgi:NADH-quinone oxidoreductase subunit L